MIIKAPAKVNLYLDVIGKRKDGYHEISTLFHSIDLYDILDIDFSESDSFSSNIKLNFPWENN
jgi:4-diphosphocytidyl-2-C-methyl-D-erythritol kinase